MRRTDQPTPHTEEPANGSQEEESEEIDQEEEEVDWSKRFAMQVASSRKIRPWQADVCFAASER
jgi:hypothetical protein